jgi:hypothetical protein
MREDLVDMLCSPGWEMYVHQLIGQAKLLHHALVQKPMPELGQAGIQGQLRALYTGLETVYKRAKTPMPTYLKILFTGDFDAESEAQ